MFTVNENNIIKELKKYNTANNILEFGFGSGGYSKLLRNAFPDSNIVGVDKNKKFNRENNKALQYLSTCIFDDINNIQDTKSKFDIITFGDFRTPFWWKFNCFSKGIYSNIIKSLDSLLVENGVFFLVLKTNKAINKSQKKFIKMSQFILENSNSTKEEWESDFISNNNVIYDTISIFNDFGYSKISEVEYEDTEMVKASQNPCLEFYNKMKIDNPYLEQKAISIDKNIEEYGLTFGYFKILTFQK